VRAPQAGEELLPLESMCLELLRPQKPRPHEGSEALEATSNPGQG